MEQFDMELQRDRFLRIFDEKVGDRKGKDDLRDWLLSDDCDFFTAPASTKYHGAYLGGLCEHSLDVYDMAVRLAEMYAEDIRKKYLVLNRPYSRDEFMESLTIAALFHDLCKVGFYQVKNMVRGSSIVVREQLSETK